jgi:hypothetical protein
VVRDTVQKVLAGRPGQEGTGANPKDAIAELVTVHGIPDLLDSIKVKHVSGGLSVIGLKTYGAGREKFQGETPSYADQRWRQSRLDDVHATAGRLNRGEAVPA